MSGALHGTVELLDGLAFRATTGSGHTLTLDATPTLGGAGHGPSPLELLLLGLGGCLGMSVLLLLKRERPRLASYQVRLRAEQASTHPRVFTEIVVEHVFRGRDLPIERIQRVIERSATRYCPASAMLAQTARIDERFRVIDEATGTETSGTVASGSDHQGEPGTAKKR